MQVDEIRWLFAYDRWATRRVLAVLDGLGPAVWTRTNAIGDRSLGSVLVHHLGASQLWRVGFQTQGTVEGPAPERGPLPTSDELRDRWEAEWAAVDAWLPTVTEDFVGHVYEGADVGARGEPRHAAPGGGGGASYKQALRMEDGCQRHLR